jgi:superfamily II DNA or RNA helicase
VPRIYDNLENPLAPALQHELSGGDRADFCVGYFNLRGWAHLAAPVDHLAAPREACRVLVGMHRAPRELVRALHGAGPDKIDVATTKVLVRRVCQDFRLQLTTGLPTKADEATLRHLAAQLRAARVRVRLHLREPLHAKLYLVHRADRAAPIVGFLGSSNLTFSGLTGNGELNIDVTDHDAASKLARWFEARWGDKFSLDISEDLANVLDESWASDRPVPPFHVYVKIAWHLSREARAGVAEFRVPAAIDRELFDFQRAAVKIAAHHIHHRGGVMLGDVVGLGKTMMATALARVLDDDLGYESLILCPKNLVPMWEHYRERHGLHAKVVSYARVQKVLPTLRRFRLVILDESHNLRNREGRRYRAIAEYIRQNESRCVLLTATPYNKSYLDLASQLRLFVPDDRDLGARPEALLRELGEAEFMRRHQCPPRTLAAFEKSDHVDDWRDLMRLFLVRRTRSFIRRHHATLDPETNRRYLTFADGTRAYFPDRVPRTLRFPLDESSPNDSYARLYAAPVVGALLGLLLPRYGLGDHVRADADKKATPEERAILDGLAKSGRRLQGFCRVNLFKRLESSGAAFLESIERHCLRNHVFIEALRRGAELPIGPQESALLDAVVDDGELPTLFDDDDAPAPDAPELRQGAFESRAARVLESYRAEHHNHFRWLRAELFKPSLKKALLADAEALAAILRDAGRWNPARDAKLTELHALVTKTHPDEKVLVFTQFADTASYLAEALAALGVADVGCVTGNSDTPTETVWRFSPRSNQQTIASADELRVLIATDVLSEGQNLQDAAIVVNYDLPWAVIRLIQRAGRVDRIGQRATQITCYSFLPSDGVERLIRLRSRMRQRLQENAEVVGTDETFFDDDDQRQVVDLYNEKAGILDGDDDAEIDLASYAWQVWRDSVAADPSLEKTIPALADVVYATRAAQPSDARPPGVIVYVRTAQDTDALCLLDAEGRSVTESQFEILKLARCRADTPALPARDDHHDLVAKAVDLVAREENLPGGQLGRPSGVRFRTYTRLKRFVDREGALFVSKELLRAVDEVYLRPLRASAVDTLGRQLRSGIDDAQLVELVLALRDDERLCVRPDDDEEARREPRIVCSMGIA